MRQSKGKQLKARIGEGPVEVFTCIVVVEESMQGWLALLHRLEPGPGQVTTYERMQESLTASGKLGILPFDADAAEVFVELRRALRRLGTMDLKIAATCLIHDATLLTRNVADFKGIPGLQIENWLD